MLTVSCSSLMTCRVWRSHRHGHYWDYHNSSDELDRHDTSIGEAREQILAAIKSADAGIDEVPNPSLLINVARKKPAAGSSLAM